MAEQIGPLLVRLRKRAGLSQKELAYAARIPRSWLSVVEIGRVEQPDRERLIKIARALRVEADAILSSAGLSGTSIEPPASRTVADLLREALAREQETERVILVRVAENATASAGMGGVGDDPIPYLPPPEHRNHDFTAIRVIGECMEPEIRAGDIAIVDRSADPQPGDIVVVNIDGEVHVKRLRGRNGTQFLEANQTSYPPVPLGRDTRIIGVVRWSGRPH